MIDWNASAELNNRAVDELKDYFEKYPGSEKRIITICDGCHKLRNVPFWRYTDLCISCVQKKRCADPEVRKAMSETMIKYHIDHPELAIDHSKLMIEYYSDPVNYDAALKRAAKRWENPKEHEKVSKRMKQYLKEHPEAIISWQEKMVKYWSDPKNIDEMSKIKKQYYIDNPEACEAARLKSIEQFSTQEARDAQAIRIKNSNASKAESKRQRGGFDIVKHHNIYDHNDLSKYTTEMTRSEHQSLHRNMQILNIKIPHINTGHENGEELKLMEYIKKIEANNQ